MEKIKIYQLADELKIERKVMLKKAQEFGSPAKNTSKLLTEGEVKQLKKFFCPPKPKKKAKTKPKAKTVSEPSQASIKKRSEKKIEAVTSQNEAQHWRPERTKRGFHLPSVCSLKSKSKKTKNQKAEKPVEEVLSVPQYFNPYQKKSMAPSTVSWILRGVVLVLVASNALTIGLVLSHYRPTTRVISEAQSVTHSQADTNYRAKVFLDDYVKTFFTSPASMSIEDYQKQLAPFYGKSLTFLSGNFQRGDSQFESSSLLSLNDHEAVYRVNYSIADGTIQSCEMTIAYEAIGSSFVVVDMPVFSQVKDMFADEKKIEPVVLTAPDQLSEGDHKELDEFVTGLFKAYTTNQSLLDNVSQGLQFNDYETFTKLVYSYYQKQSDGSYKAYVSAVFKSDLGEYPQNMSFTIQKNKSSYFATDFKFHIPANYDKQTNQTNK